MILMTLVIIFLTLIIILGMLNKSDFEIEVEFSAVPPKFKIRLKKKQGKLSKAKSKNS